MTEKLDDAFDRLILSSVPIEISSIERNFYQRTFSKSKYKTK